MYYIILSGDSHYIQKDAKSQFVSFSKYNHELCLGHTKPEILKNYSLHDYVMEFGHEFLTFFGTNGQLMTAFELLKNVIPALSKYRHGFIKDGSIFYADDNAIASEWMADQDEILLRAWARSNGIILTN